MAYDPVMEALEETKALEAIAEQRRKVEDEQRKLNQMEAEEKARPFTVAKLVAILTDPQLNPRVQGFDVWAEGCDCVNVVNSVEIDMAGESITLEVR